jgi:hypothetical protein
MVRPYLHEHRSALRGTPRFGFAWVPNAHLELNLLALFEVALIPATWRDALNYSRRNSPSSLRLAPYREQHEMISYF